MNDSLNPRLSSLLEQSIEEYIKNAVPIASGKITTSKSPATVRNDLKILEEMGYLRQVHTSSGRVPTTQGYRYYVNRVMGDLKLKVGELSNAASIITERTAELPDIINEICKKLESTFDGAGDFRRQFDKLTIENITLIPLIAATLGLLPTARTL